MFKFNNIEFSQFWLKFVTRTDKDVGRGYGLVVNKDKDDNTTVLKYKQWIILFHFSMSAPDMERQDPAPAEIPVTPLPGLVPF